MGEQRPIRHTVTVESHSSHRDGHVTFVTPCWSRHIRHTVTVTSHYCDGRMGERWQHHSLSSVRYTQGSPLVQLIGRKIFLAERDMYNETRYASRLNAVW